MEKVFLPGFLSSNLYYKYLNDLIHSVRGDEFLGGNVSLTAPGSVGPPDESHPGGSDSSASQSSVKKASIKILKNFDEAIVVDAASLDPESLYQRTYAGKMTFGRVSDLGQFIRESEPEPDVKKSKEGELALPLQKAHEYEKALSIFLFNGKMPNQVGLDSLHLMQFLDDTSEVKRNLQSGVSSGGHQPHELGLGCLADQSSFFPCKDRQ
ncbi:hypothetical protein P7K49_010815 [Saguinus oedipus]|uniref:Uncharacterized protein n=1 Tax=Saguinus oedipus TaxID=9490 RepID=A0ABQ9VQ97_SAGOE|nr:hypothetical protein P7K49_010815 [Saguinus oedipus]